MDVLIWVLFVIVFVVFELVSNTFVFLWLAIASGIAGIFNYFGFDIYVQFILFVVVFLVLILSTRKFANRFSGENEKKVASERLIGRDAKVIRVVDGNAFVVSVAGEEWLAHTYDSVDVDDIVKVTGIDSIILNIEKIE